VVQIFVFLLYIEADVVLMKDVVSWQSTREHHYDFSTYLYILDDVCTDIDSKITKSVENQHSVVLALIKYMYITNSGRLTVMAIVPNVLP
jgi:hypothetical protein